MALKFEWTGINDLDRVSMIRWQSFLARGSDLPPHRDDRPAGRLGEGDVCIASDAGQDIGTATSLSLHLYVRGKRVPCQGVAWVGTSKAHRRRRAGEKGVATQVMEQTLNKARERRQVASALMPFRVSFYEHFGYGIVERQNIWTIPMPLIDADRAGDWRFGTPADKPAMIACRARQSESGQCDIETDARALDEWFAGLSNDTQFFVDERQGAIRAYTWIRTLAENDRKIAQAVQPSWDSFEGFQSLLGLLGSLKDQYSFARLVLPVDLPVNRLLRETQIPHRPIEHRASACQMLSRMQLRVLDHAGFLSGQKLVRPISGKVVVAVKESEGSRSVVQLDISEGVIDARSSMLAPDVELSDVAWAAIACGDLRANFAAKAGLIDVHQASALPILDVLADGAAPFCFEYF